jgi:hypothetical protein
MRKQEIPGSNLGRSSDYVNNPLTQLLSQSTLQRNQSRLIPQSFISSQSANPFMTSDIEPLGKVDNIRITISDSSLRYTPLAQISLENIINAYKPVWSGFLTSSIEGDMIVLNPSANDQRKVEDQIIEYVKIACLIQHLANLYGMKRDPKPSIDVSQQYRVYIPTRSFQSIGGLYTAPIEIKDLLVHLLRGVLPNLSFLPRSGIPNNVRSYNINNQATKEILTSFIFLEDEVKRYIVYEKGRVELLGGKLSELAVIPVPSNMMALLMLQYLAKENLVAIQAWKTVKLQELTVKSQTTIHNQTTVRKPSIQQIRIKGSNKTFLPPVDKIVYDPNSLDTANIYSYENAIAYFVYLKKNYKEGILFESLITPTYGIKIIRDYLWAPAEVMAALLDTGFLKHNNIIGKESKVIGKTGIARWKLTSEGLNVIKSVFGDGINQTEFRVRPLGKAEIISGDPSVFEFLETVLNKESLRIVEKVINKESGGTITFEANYFIIMKIYFAIKLVRGATLISEMNPIEHLYGSEALLDISERTPFGALHILRIPRGNSMDIYLVSKNQEAYISLLSAVSDEVRSSIILQEIEPGVLGRKLTGASVFYVFYALEQSVQ